MKEITSTNPAKNYQTIGRVKVSSKKEIQNKVLEANSAKLEWKELGTQQRVKILRPVYDKLAEKKQELTLLETREMGKPISQSFGDVDSGLEYFKWYLDNTEKILTPEITYEDNHLIHRLFFEPIGTAAVIMPWNFPFSNSVWGIIPNLVAGNPVVFKHSEECPLFGKSIEDIINSCNLPKGIFSEIYGDGKIGDHLLHQDINLICFTGSTKVGKYLYQVGAEKFIKVLLELGGSAPGVVFDDADIDNTLTSIYNKRFGNCGQICTALKRLIVQEDVANEVIEKLKVLLESKKVGDPEDNNTDIGPLVAKRQLKLLISQVKDATTKGAKVIIGGKTPKKLQGAFYKPTILTDITTNMRVWQEEVFGPVLPVVTFKTEEEAIKLANDTRYGLGGYIFTNDKEKAARVASKIESGNISINGAVGHIPWSPFGGYKESGLGREHGKHGLRELCQIKVVSIKK